MDYFYEEQALNPSLRITACPKVPVIDDLFGYRIRFNVITREKGGLANLTSNLITNVERLVTNRFNLRDAIVIGLIDSYLKEVDLSYFASGTNVSTLLGPELNSALPFLAPAVEQSGAVILNLTIGEASTLVYYLKELDELLEAAPVVILTITDGGPIAAALIKNINELRTSAHYNYYRLKELYPFGGDSNPKSFEVVDYIATIHHERRAEFLQERYSLIPKPRQGKLADLIIRPVTV